MVYFQVTGSGRDVGGSPARTALVTPGSAAVMDPLASAVDPVPLDSPETVPATVSNGKRSVRSLSQMLDGCTCELVIDVNYLHMLFALSGTVQEFPQEGVLTNQKKLKYKNGAPRV